MVTKPVVYLTLLLGALIVLSSGTLLSSEARVLIAPTPTPQVPTPSPAPESINNVPIPRHPQPLYGPNREPSATEYLNRGLGSDDVDCDGVKNQEDNCISVFNPSQKKTRPGDDGDSCNRALRDSKEEDLRCDFDGDGVFDEKDNCPLVHNPKQKDRNKNGKGDACEAKSQQKTTSEKKCSR
jgi:hypothetical protein